MQDCLGSRVDAVLRPAGVLAPLLETRLESARLVRPVVGQHVEVVLAGVADRHAGGLRRRDRLRDRPLVLALLACGMTYAGGINGQVKMLGTCMGAHDCKASFACLCSPGCF